MMEPTARDRRWQKRYDKMGTIIERSRKDGSKAFTAQIVIKKGGAIVHREAADIRPQTRGQRLDRQTRGRAQAPGRPRAERRSHPLSRHRSLHRGIENAVLGTKAQVLKTIKNSDLGEIKCSEITSHALVSFARELTKNIEPQTCGNYFSHLSNIFTVARPAWGYPLSRQEFDDAVTVLKKLGLIERVASATAGRRWKNSTG